LVDKTLRTGPGVC